MHTNMRSITTLADNSSVGPLGTIGVDQVVLAICLVVVFALLAGAAGVDLCANTNTLTFLDESHLRTNANGLPNDFWMHRGERLANAQANAAFP